MVSVSSDGVVASSDVLSVWSDDAVASSDELSVESGVQGHHLMSESDVLVYCAVESIVL